MYVSIMRLYILRHEDRTQDCSFFAPLTYDGLENAKKLVEKLEKEKIDIIISSPFIRTLQTIFPYANKTKKDINIEYGLSEIHHQDIIPVKAVGISMPEYLLKTFNYNLKYKTIIQPNDISYPETISQVKNRMKKVLHYILSNYHNTHSNILIVTHQSLCNYVLEIIKDNSKVINSKTFKDITDRLVSGYPTGKLSLIFNKVAWEYEEIN